MLNKFRDLYALSRWDGSTTADVVYVGWLGPGGRWVIEKYDTANGTVTFARGEEDFSNNWTNIATLSYSEYNTEF